MPPYQALGEAMARADNAQQKTEDHDQVAAMDRQTDAMLALVEQIKGAREDFKPAADAVHSLGAAQAQFCDFIVNNRVKILGGGLAALAAVGAISPNLANVIGAALKAWGIQ